jgi:hypothetical protein
MNPARTSGIRRTVVVVALLGTEVAAVVTLQRLGRVAGFAFPQHDVARWATHASTEDLFAVSARFAGLGLAWWLLGATVLSLARRLVPGCRRLRAFDAGTPAILRRALDRALAIGLGASIGLASIHPAGALAAPPSSRATRDTPVVRSTGFPAQPSVPPRAASPRRDRFVVVRAGDNLWAISARSLPDDSTEIAPYWRRIVAANAPTLRSRDPNMIFPGERIVLPANDSARG